MNHTEKTIPVWEEIFFKCFRKQQNITELEKRD